MLNYDNYAITLGRAVELFRRGREAVPEQKTALRTLTALAQLGAVVLEVGEGELRVGGSLVSPALPGILPLLGQLEGHDVEEIGIDQAASPASLLHLLRGLAEPLGGFRLGDDLASRLRTAGVADVRVRLRVRRVAAPPVAPRRSDPVVADVTTEQLALSAAVQDARRLSQPEAAVAAIALDPDSPQVGAHLETAAVRIREEMEHGRPSGAVRALAQLIQLEGGVPPGPAQETLRGAIEPLLTRAVFTGALACAATDATRPAAIRVLQRGGPAATALLRERLLTDRDDASAHRTLALLRGQPEGLRSLILLLQHGESGVVCRAAEVLGLLGLREAVPALTRVARHADPAVRAAVGGALARLATSEALDMLGELLDEARPHELSGLVDAVRGGALGPIVPRLDAAGRRVRDAATLMALGHALGRIGTPEAVGVLARWAERPGWRFWRRRGPARLAAVEGLRIAGGPGALGLLEDLVRDRDLAVRRAATEAVEDLSIAAHARGP